ncbi:dicarboxylate/amino acid:cation symporter [Tautonia plasticadhaerens]|uniref:Proton glutamate symport protein n=1 Tax=Tautonia plasticadhaerens TaxID=2527974 RepID=A0A518GYU2_9BACT|nr:dicarboxylate/amino acid:cation symporter [Tautonia plasticadhaerens]QDV33745.1 Proton glutamate symport protein [Tautonia plasticadhaerens]
MDDEKAVNPTIEEAEASKSLPLYAWVVLAVLLAIPAGMLLGADGSWYDRMPGAARVILGGLATAMELAPVLIIRALGALAAPLVVLAILSAIVTNDIRGLQGARMMGFYLVNTLVAMVIGLAASNLIRPGAGADLGASAVASAEDPRLIDRLIDRPSPRAMAPGKTVAEIFVEMVPRSVGEAFSSNNLAQLVLMTVAFGIALAQYRDRQRAAGETTYRAMVDVLVVGFELLMKILLWVVALVPIAVFGVVAISLAREGFGLFLQLGWFIATVLAGFACQVAWYLSQLGVLGRYGPVRFLRGSADVVAMTFSTASTAATIPITLKALTGRLGVSRASSQLAACVGTNFNNDGTALYQAVAALFFAQALGADLTLTDQVVIMLTTLLASVGAGGIPSGSFVTLPLIFAAVRLPAEALPLLLTIDWFLDRCRTTVNVIGDMTVAVLLDRFEPGPDQPEPASSER